MITPSPRLHIVIPSRGRADWDKQLTLNAILSAGRQVRLVVAKEEANAYRKLFLNKGRSNVGGLVKVEECPSTSSLTIGATRNWITRKLFHDERILMLDDDLHFWFRPTLSVTVEPARPMDILRMLLDIDIALTPDCPMVGIAYKKHALGHQYINKKARIAGAYALDLQQLRANNVIFQRRMCVYEDLHVQLCVLIAGMQTATLSQYCYTTAEKPVKPPRQVALSLRHLVKKHKRYVKLVSNIPAVDWNKLV